MKLRYYLFTALCGSFLGIVLVSMNSCSVKEKEEGPTEMHSIEENGKRVFYDETQKAYDSIYLGMNQTDVDSMMSSTEIRGTTYTMIPEYSTDGKLNSLFFRSDTVLKANRMQVAEELSSVLSHKYGTPNYGSVSQMGVGIVEEGNVGEHSVSWGAHWSKDPKHIIIGVEDPTDSTSYIWWWVFNKNVWNNQGGSVAQEDLSKL